MRKNAITLFLSLSAFATACSTISTFDQYAYTQTTSLKVDVISLMGHASESYSLYQTQASGITTALNKMFEYEKNRPKNTITQKMWTVLTDSTGNLYGGFMKRWEKEGKLDTAFVRISQGLVSQSFDQISQLESGKINPKQLGN